MRTGFSLVELSIVLVILGLLTGGILTGQNLIRAAELRAVVTEYQQYKAALHTFQDKYFALPGDMTNATAFWGDNASACADAAVADGSPGTCNGNGDGLVTEAAAANSPGEAFGFWVQLSLAGMVEGSYTGLSGSGSEGHSLPGVNIAKSRLGTAGWGFKYGTLDGYGLVGQRYTNMPYRYINHFIFGGAASNGVGINSNPVMTPAEAWGIDKKVDDGKPAMGNFVTYNSIICADTLDAPSAEYNLSNESTACWFVIRN
jgi:prepilin-type N-terminal cleavage/methylation domain-containing protein